MDYVRFWFGFTAFGIASAVAILYWALSKRQFREPDRAAYLALSDLDVPPPESRPSTEARVLKSLLGVGLALLGLTAVLAQLW